MPFPTPEMKINDTRGRNSSDPSRQVDCETVRSLSEKAKRDLVGAARTHSPPDDKDKQSVDQSLRNTTRTVRGRGSPLLRFRGHVWDNA